MRRWLVIVALAFAGCATKPGQACSEDKDCGSGFDCYQKACTRVCTKVEECDAGDQCVRYRCVHEAAATPQRPMMAGPRGEMPGSATPPLPDSTAAELRALRHEVEEIRRDQARILELLGQQKAAPKSAPKLP